LRIFGEGCGIKKYPILTQCYIIKIFLLDEVSILILLFMVVSLSVISTNNAMGVSKSMPDIHPIHVDSIWNVDVNGTKGTQNYSSY
jgi:hypothetical protein